MTCSKVTCDVPGCQSYSELSAQEDLKAIGEALRVRGWLTSYPKANGRVLHVCPTHADLVRTKGWTEVRDVIEKGNGKDS